MQDSHVYREILLGNIPSACYAGQEIYVQLEKLKIYL